jgi:hypothetical protein
MITGTRTLPRRHVLTVTVGAMLALTAACGDQAKPADTTASSAPAVTASAPLPTPSGSSVGGGTTVKDSGDLPDVCALLSKAEVSTLTGRSITQVDVDGAKPGDPTRYCQWQLSEGQLAVFLTRTTKEEFQLRAPQSTQVPAVADEAYLNSGHLYALYGTIQLDVYARGKSDAENVNTAKATVAALLPRI